MASKECKSYYGPRFTEMKKESNGKRVSKHRSKVITIKEKNKQLKWRRELYAKNEKSREKNNEKKRLLYQENKEKIKAKNEEKSEDFFNYFSYLIEL